jgi:hypothetical protein
LQPTKTINHTKKEAYLDVPNKIERQEIPQVGQPYEDAATKAIPQLRAANQNNVIY